MATSRPKSVSTYTSRATRLVTTTAEWVPDDAWLALSTHANLLLLGSSARVESVIAAIYPDLALPCLIWTPTREMRLPRRAVYTFIFRNIDQLRLEEQQRLYRWLTNAPRRPQIVSTSDHSLMGLIHSGSFLEDLYYRLNTITIPVDEEQ